MNFAQQKRRIQAFIAASLLIILGAFTGLGFNQATNQLPPEHLRRKAEGFAFQLRRFQVDIGSDDAAKTYYKAKVSPQMQLLLPDTIVTSTIKDLLEYFGYSTVTAKDMHRLSSDDLMKLSAEGDILATRFFAPKISQVSTPPAATPASGFGWRKLIRFKAKAGSKAVDNNMETFIFLQNIFEKTADGNPFDADKNVSIFNQVIVVRKDAGPFTDNKLPLYFITYGPLVKVSSSGVPIKDASGNFQDDGLISTSLKATFDGRDPESGVPVKEYFVPDSCAQCHGGNIRRAKANYLDTDHWLDRVTPKYGLSDPKYSQEDFTALASSSFQVLYDGEKDQTTEKSKKAFDVIYQLNDEIRIQNARLGTAGNFQLNAVTRWLDLHKPDKFGRNHVPPYERGFGNQLWDPSKDDHRKTLYYLNRYCYRCHSSVRYNVFDREAVLGRVASIRTRLLNIDDPGSWMPQDRIFPGLTINPNTGEGQETGDLKEFLDLLSHP